MITGRIVRLFVALRPPEAVLDEVSAAVEVLRAAAPELRWTPREQWHLTLCFLGEVDPAVVPRLTDRLREAAQVAHAPELWLAGGGRFGRNVLWVGVGGETDILASLVRAVNRAVRSCRIGIERRPYRPHLTVARARRSGSVGPAEGLTDFRSASWRADQIELVHSRLGAGPGRTAIHARLAEFGLLGQAYPRRHCSCTDRQLD
jgi:2'-5' RNA ligase